MCGAMAAQPFRSDKNSVFSEQLLKSWAKQHSMLQKRTTTFSCGTMFAGGFLVY